MTRIKKITFSIAANPIMYILWCCAIASSFIFIQDIAYGAEGSSITGYMTFWIWITAILATFVDRIAYYNYSKPSSINGHNIPEYSAKKLHGDNESAKYTITPETQLSYGDIILLEVGDVAPHDGIIIKGISYVNQTSITGELDAVLKFTTAGHNKIMQGSIVESDWLVVKITQSKSSSLINKMSKMLKAIEREPAPSEVALGRVIFGMTILFVVITLSIAAIGYYSGIAIKNIYLLDLLVTLLPTTISGLLYTISIHGSSLLSSHNIAVTDKRALDIALDVNVVIFDKTGTLTIGQREAVSFTAFDTTDEELATLIYLASIDDDTKEGESIARFAEGQLNYHNGVPEVDRSHYSYFPFSSSRPISGCDYMGYKISKGSITAICNELGISETDLPTEILELRNSVASACGTPLLVAHNNKVIGLIHLQDRLQKNIKKQIDRVQEQGIMTILITGDNELTAAYVAKKLGMQAFYAEASPEDKLGFVRDMQSRGYVVAMYGDGVNDVPALAQSDIGISFSYSNHHALAACNIISLNHSLDTLVDLKSICRKMSIKRGGLMVFSLASDIAKYFAIVPSLFNTQLPELKVFNIMNLYSVDSAMLASVIWSAFAIIGVMPLVYVDREDRDDQSLLWRNIALYGLIGIFAPFICIKLIDMAIVALKVVI